MVLIESERLTFYLTSFIGCGTCEEIVAERTGVEFGLYYLSDSFLTVIEDERAVAV